MRGPPGPGGMTGRSGPLVSSLRQPKHKHTTDLITAPASPFTFYEKLIRWLELLPVKALGPNINAPPAHTPRRACALPLSSSTSACEQIGSITMSTNFAGFLTPNTLQDWFNSSVSSGMEKKLFSVPQFLIPTRVTSVFCSLTRSVCACQQGGPGAPGLKGDSGDSGPQVKTFLCPQDQQQASNSQTCRRLYSLIPMCFPQRDPEVFRVQLVHQGRRERG